MIIGDRLLGEPVQIAIHAQRLDLGGYLEHDATKLAPLTVGERTATKISDLSMDAPRVCT